MKHAQPFSVRIYTGSGQLDRVEERATAQQAISCAYQWQRMQSATAIEVVQHATADASDRLLVWMVRCEANGIFYDKLDPEQVARLSAANDVEPAARIGKMIADTTDLFYDEAREIAVELIEVWQSMRSRVRHAKSGHVQDACVSASIAFRADIVKRYGDEIMRVVDAECIKQTPVDVAAARGYQPSETTQWLIDNAPETFPSDLDPEPETTDRPGDLLKSQGFHVAGDAMNRRAALARRASEIDEENLMRDERGQARLCECDCGRETPLAKYVDADCRTRAISMRISAV